MKKTIAALLLLGFISAIPSAYAEMYDSRTQEGYPANAPRWADYVPPKYQNPRTDYSKGGAVTEIIVGCLAIPFTIPLITHGSKKLKNISYAEKKRIFFNGLEQSKTMTPAQQQQFYPQLLKQADLLKK